MSRSLKFSLLSHWFVSTSFIACVGLAHAQSVIKIDGSSTVYPVTKIAADQFEVMKKNTVKIAMEISGSGGGFKKAKSILQMLRVQFRKKNFSNAKMRRFNS